MTKVKVLKKVVFKFILKKTSILAWAYVVSLFQISGAETENALDL